MQSPHYKNLKIGALGASLVAASTVATFFPIHASISDSVEQERTTAATPTPTATTTPSFLHPDCPAGRRENNSDPESTRTPDDEATQSIEPLADAEYFDGQYSGDPVLARGWGTMQLEVVIEGGRLVNIIVDQYPRATFQSNLITRNALPTLICEALEAQDSDIDFVSRATDSSRAFVQSLESALLDAAIGIDL